MRMQFVLAVAVVLAVTAGVIASSGDSSALYQTCLFTCKSSVCTLNPPMPLSLRLTGWSCEDNCKYKCMHDITAQAVARGASVEQYYGKWPFYRFLGMQEPMSVLFSIANGYMHYRHWPILKRYLPDTYFLKPYILGWCIVGINSWVWSSVFHTRDYPWTEKFDYFSAGATVMYAFHVAVLQVFGIKNKTFRTTWSIACFLPWLAHISYLSFVKFDYGYNMLANIVVGLINNSLWIGWTIYHWNDRPFAWMPTFCVLAISAAMSLEVLDFPPILYMLDAHSLWHFSTIWLIPVWYRFQLKEAAWEDSSKGGEKRDYIQ